MVRWWKWCWTRKSGISLTFQHGSHSEKIQKFIEFPLELDLANRCSSQVKSNSSRYALYAVVEHSGTLRSGHYVAYVKHSMNDESVPDNLCSKPVDDLLKNLFQTTTSNEECSASKTIVKTTDPSAPPPSWYHISDNTIHKVPESKVLEADAYVLFYRKMQDRVWVILFFPVMIKINRVLPRQLSFDRGIVSMRSISFISTSLTAASI